MYLTMFNCFKITGVDSSEVSSTAYTQNTKSVEKKIKIKKVTEGPEDNCISGDMLLPYHIETCTSILSSSEICN